METSRERRLPLQAGDYQAVTALSADGTTITSIGSVFTANGRHFLRSAMTSPTIIRVWDVATGQEKRQFPGGKGCVQSMALSPDGKSLLSVNAQWIRGFQSYSADLWNVTTGKRLRTVDKNEGGGLLSSMGMTGAFSSDNRFYAVRSVDDSLSLYDVSTSSKLDHYKGSDSIKISASQGITFSPDGQELATVGNSKRNQAKSVICLLQLGWSGKKRVLENPRMITGHEGPIFALAYSPDGRTIASAGESGTIYVWETASGKERCRFTGHNGQVWCLAFAPDGCRIASGSNDTTILIWDITGRLDHGQLRPDPLSARSVEQLWADLGSSDAQQAGQAVWTLASAPEAAIAFLKKQLVPVPAEKDLDQRIAQLINQLDDDSFRVRKKAVSELTKLGQAAEPALRHVLESSVSAETKNCAKQILVALQKKKTFPSNEDCRRIRALEVLEQCGTLAARQLLKSLAQGEPAALLTRESQAVLARPSRRTVQQR